MDKIKIIIVFITKVIHIFTCICKSSYFRFVTKYIFFINGIECDSFRTNGKPTIIKSKKGNFVIGDHFAMNNGLHGNPIGFNEPCIFIISDNSTIRIGNNVGISQATLFAIKDITIGDNVKIGGGTRIYTTDFHSLDYRLRKNASEDVKNRVSAQVIIKSDVFIGSGCTILKGVVVGERSIIGAGSVVTKSIPADELWAGNPARFIRRINKDEKNNSSINNRI